MKIKELLDKVIEPHFRNDKMIPKYLKLYKDQLLKCEEFKDIDDLIIIDEPDFTLGDGDLDESFNSKYIKLDSDIKLKGTVYLYGISLTPELFNPCLHLTQFKENALVTPTMYDPKNLTPYQYFMIKWSPEFAQDMIGTGQEPDLRKILHDKLDELIDNQEKYRIKGERGVMIRGVFDI